MQVVAVGTGTCGFKHFCFPAVSMMRRLGICEFELFDIFEGVVLKFGTNSGSHCWQGGLAEADAVCWPSGCVNTHPRPSPRALLGVSENAGYLLGFSPLY